MTIKFEDADVELTFLRQDGVEQIQTDDVDISGSLAKISPDEIANATKSLASVGTALLLEDELEGWKKPEEVEVEFGIAIGAGGRILVAKGDIKAHIKIKIKW